MFITKTIELGRESLKLPGGYLDLRSGHRIWSTSGGETSSVATNESAFVALVLHQLCEHLRIDGGRHAVLTLRTSTSSMPVRPAVFVEVSVLSPLLTCGVVCRWASRCYIGIDPGHAMTRIEGDARVEFLYAAVDIVDGVDDWHSCVIFSF
jgi:hypothetical protein